ncbi:MAG TPA: hypothetical protein VG778_02110, partial [Blastocatellia bacterium]|nr:hypothetical protein [Blastocatellia bacterium]
MRDRDEERDPSDIGEERPFSWRRIRIAAIGSVVAILLGAVLVSFYTWSQYGGTPFDSFFGREPQQSPNVGKLAFTTGTDFFVGVIKGEGVNTRRVKVFYIEQAGGQMIEVAQERVEVREPRKAP